VAVVHTSLKRYAIVGERYWPSRERFAELQMNDVLIGLDLTVNAVEDLADEQFEHLLEEEEKKTKKNGIHDASNSKQYFLRAILSILLKL
jgi:hypothetical protein